MCIALLIGTTLAWFTDSVSNRGNRIQAGSLQIDLLQLGATLSDTQEDEIIEAGESSINDTEYYSIRNIEAPVFDYDLWEPGYTEIKALGVKNNGSLALKYRLDITADGSAGSLADVIDVYVKISDTPITTIPVSFAEITAADSGYRNAGTLSSLMEDEDGTAYGNLYPPTSGEASQAYVAVVFHMQESSGNDYQGESIGDEFDINLTATQLTYEEDGFGNQNYDEDAVMVHDGQALETALENGGVIDVMEDINLNTEKADACEGENFAYTDLNVTEDTVLDLNGNTLRVRGSIYAKEGANLTIRGGTVEYAPCEHIANGGKLPVINPINANVVLDNVTVSGDMGYQQLIQVSNNNYWDQEGDTSLTVKESIINGSIGLYQADDYDLAVTVEEGTVLNNKDGSYAFYMTGKPWLTINGGEFNAADLIDVGGKIEAAASVVINGGNFNLKGSVLAGSGKDAEFEKTATGGTLNGEPFTFTVSAD